MNIKFEGVSLLEVQSHHLQCVSIKASILSDPRGWLLNEQVVSCLETSKINFLVSNHHMRYSHSHLMSNYG